MSMTSFWPLQKVLYAKLVAHTEVIESLGGARLYDEVPATAIYPYAVFGPASSVPLGTDERESAEHELTLEVWSQRRGSGQTKKILSALVSALEEENVTLSEVTLVDLQVTKMTCEWDEDDLLTKGSLTLRVVTQNT